MVDSFAVTAHYDTAMGNYFSGKQPSPLQRMIEQPCATLWYGENPHQQAVYHGSLTDVVD